MCACIWQMCAFCIQFILYSVLFGVYVLRLYASICFFFFLVQLFASDRECVLHICVAVCIYLVFARPTFFSIVQTKVNALTMYDLQCINFSLRFCLLCALTSNPCALLLNNFYIHHIVFAGFNLFFFVRACIHAVMFLSRCLTVSLYLSKFASVFIPFIVYFWCMCMQIHTYYQLFVKVAFALSLSLSC